MASLVYLMCAATAAGCALLLLRGYRRSGSRLLMWSMLCFAAMAVDNSLLFLDRVVFPGQALFAFRRLLSVGGIAVLLYGLIWEVD
jgi:hypothetical protein